MVRSSIRPGGGRSGWTRTGELGENGRGVRGAETGGPCCEEGLGVGERFDSAAGLEPDGAGASRGPFAEVFDLRTGRTETGGGFDEIRARGLA